MVASKIGHKESTFNSGTIESLLKLEYSGGPNSIIIPGRLHFTEVDSIKYLTTMFDEPTDNTRAYFPIGTSYVGQIHPKYKNRR